MRENLKRLLFRSGKAMHYVMTVLLFTVYCYFYIHPHVSDAPTALHCRTLIIIYALLYLFLLRTYSAYDVGLSRIRMLVYSQTLANVVSGGIIYALQIVNQLRFISPLPLFGLLAVQLVMNCAWSYIANTVYLRMTSPQKTALIYGKDTDLEQLGEVIRYHRKFQVVKQIVNPSEDLQAVVEQLQDVETVFLAGVSPTLKNGILLYCVEKDIRCHISPDVSDVLIMGGKHLELFSVPVCRVMRASPQIEYMALKRTLDIVLSLMGIVVTSPFMLVTALAVKLYDGGPALYKQVRLTKDGKEFEILKFRSMRVNAEQDGIARLAAENDSRITPVGKIIRACRLDELPQLFNILRGDMSIVGPRPERPEIAKQYEQILPEFSLRLQVKAGLTGLAQVCGKYNTDPYDKLRMDLMYINRMSFLLDIQMIFATVKVLFMKTSTSGVSEGQITAVSEKESKEKEFALQ